MKLRSKAVIVLATIGLVAFTGCKKGGDNAAEQTSQAVAALEAPSSASWDKSEVNSLLKYVPSDSLFVSSSTRQLDMDNPVMKTLLSKTKEKLDGMFKVIQEQMKGDGDNAELAKAQSYYDAFKPIYDLVGDYPAHAAEFGLDPKGHQDYIGYMDGNTIVFRFTAADSAKFAGEMEKVFMNGFASIAKSDGEDPDKSKETLQQMFAPRDVQVGESTWKVLSLSFLTDEVAQKCAGCKIPNALAYHVGSGMVTAAFVDGQDTATLERLMKPAEKPLSKDALGKIEGNVTGVGYINNVALFKMLGSNEASKFLTALLDEDFSVPEGCAADVEALGAAFPKFSYRATIQDGGIVETLATLEFQDKAELKKLADLHSQSLVLAKPTSLAYVGVNLDIVKTLAYLKELSARFSAKESKCDAWKEMANGLNEMTKAVESPEAAMFINGITGVNAALDKFDLASKTFEVVANLTGPSIGATAPILLMAGKSALPALAKLSLTKNEVSELDLSSEVGVPIKVNVLLTDTDLVAGTPSYDVKAVASGSKQVNHNYLELFFDFSILGAFEEEIAKLGSVMNYGYGISFGTNEDGISFNLKISE